jgi:hypothetical protein
MRRLSWLPVATLLFGACSDGTIISRPGEDPNGGGGNPTVPGNPSNPGTPSNPGNPSMPTVPTPAMSSGAARNQCNGQTAEIAGPRLLRRLTTSELETTVRSVFGLDARTWTGPTLPPDPAAANGFTNNTDRLGVGEDHARGLASMAKQVATLATSDANLARLLPCVATGTDACAGSFLDTVGLRLYRRPLSAAEKARYTSLLTKIKGAKGDFKSWVYWALTGMLQSPNVLYRSEMGDPAGAGKYKLNQYEIATALAYTYTGGPPSADLLMLAAGNALSSPDQIEAAAHDLVYDPTGAVRPAFVAVLADFSDQWLGLAALMNINKDPVAFPDFGVAVQASLTEEVHRFVAGVMFENKGKPTDLLTAPYTYVDTNLASYYRFGQAPASGFAKVARPAGWGLGLLGQGAFLAVDATTVSTSPTKRGRLVRERLLCQKVPPPPPVVAPLPEPTAAQTTRQRYEMLHAVQDSCKGCHQLMDPIGFGLEHLDASGRYRDKEGAYDIDDSGTIGSTSAGDIAFKGAAELSQKLASLPETADCMGAFMAANAFGMDQADTACMVTSAAGELRSGAIGLADFYVRMSRSEHFRNRTP